MNLYIPTISLLILTQLPLAAKATVQVNVGCEQKVICEQTPSCKTTTLYWLSNSLILKGYEFYSEPKTQLNLNSANGEISLSTGSAKSALGVIDLSSLNCANQSNDYKQLNVTLSATTKITLSEVQTSPTCESVWDGAEWKFVKTVKYLLWINGGRSPDFSTTYQSVSCR